MENAGKCKEREESERRVFKRREYNGSSPPPPLALSGAIRRMRKGGEGRLLHRARRVHERARRRRSAWCHGLATVVVPGPTVHSAHWRRERE